MIQFYQLLQLQNYASIQEINSRIDILFENLPVNGKHLEECQELLKQARTTLSDNQRRTGYDDQLAKVAANKKLHPDIFNLLSHLQLLENSSTAVFFNASFFKREFDILFFAMPLSLLDSLSKKEFTEKSVALMEQLLPLLGKILNNATTPHEILRNLSPLINELSYWLLSLSLTEKTDRKNIPDILLKLHLEIITAYQKISELNLIATDKAFLATHLYYLSGIYINQGNEETANKTLMKSIEIMQFIPETNRSFADNFVLTKSLFNVGVYLYNQSKKDSHFLDSNENNQANDPELPQRYLQEAKNLAMKLLSTPESSTGKNLLINLINESNRHLELCYPSKQIPTDLNFTQEEKYSERDSIQAPDQEPFNLDIQPFTSSTTDCSYITLPALADLKSTADYSILRKLLTCKNLPLKPFFTMNVIELQDNIAKHAVWAFHNIYSIPYPKQDDLNENIARYYHGITHVASAALYVPVLANLYRRHGDKAALQLTEEDIKLIQIAALFHDAAREDENIDYWDQDSSILLYFYLTNVLKVNKQKAVLLAEAVANKDATTQYSHLVEDENGKLSWQIGAAQPKNIYQKLIHDADCLDILRARPHFDASYLDFFNDIVLPSERYDSGNVNNCLPFDEMAKIITEVRSFVSRRGDAFELTKSSVKKLYEHALAYSSLENLINDNKNDYTALHTLYNSGKLLSAEDLKKEIMSHDKYDPNKPLDQANMTAAINELQAFYRGCATSSSHRLKIIILDNSNPTSQTNSHHAETSETLAQVEIYKAFRRLGVPTRSKKSDNMTKDGNPRRSISLIGYGGSTYTEAGFIIIDPVIEDISKVSLTDCGSSIHKKEHLGEEKISPDIIREQLEYLRRKQKMGGSSSRIAGEVLLTHSELLYKIKKFDAVCFTLDRTSFTQHFSGLSESAHQYSPILQAIYLQKTYERMTKIKLPIFEYSGTHNKIELREYDEKTIIQMWTDMCSDFIKKTYESNAVKILWTAICYEAIANGADPSIIDKLFDEDNNNEDEKITSPASVLLEVDSLLKKPTPQSTSSSSKKIQQSTLDHIKIFSMYGDCDTSRVKCHAPADLELCDLISTTIKEKLEVIIASHTQLIQHNLTTKKPFLSNEKFLSDYIKICTNVPTFIRTYFFLANKAGVPLSQKKHFLLNLLKCFSDDDLEKYLDRILAVDGIELLLTDPDIYQFIDETLSLIPDDQASYQSLFFTAAGRGDCTLVEMLLNNGIVTANMENESGNNALLYATWYGQKNVLELLIKHGGDTQATFEPYGTLFLNAIHRKKDNIIDFLLSTTDCRIDYTISLSSLDIISLAEKNKRTKVVMGLFDLKAKQAHHSMYTVSRDENSSYDDSINRVSISGFTAIHCAILMGEYPLVKKLLEHKADPTKTVQGVSPLQLAEAMGNTETISLIKTYNASYSKNYKEDPSRQQQQYFMPFEKLFTYQKLNSGVSCHSSFFNSNTTAKTYDSQKHASLKRGRDKNSESTIDYQPTKHVKIEHSTVEFRQ